MFSWWPVSRKDYTELEASYQAALAREKVNAARLIEKGGVPLTAEDKEPEEVFVTIPPEKCARFWELADAYALAPSHADKGAAHTLWSFIAAIFPEVREGKWDLVKSSTFHPKIVKKSS